MLTFPQYCNRSIKYLAFLLQILKHIHNLFVIFWTTLSPYHPAIWVSFHPSSILDSPFPRSVSSSFCLDCFICRTTNSSKILSGKGAWEITFLNCYLKSLYSFFTLNGGLGGHWITLKSLLAQLALNPSEPVLKGLCGSDFFILPKRPGSFLWKCVWLLHSHCSEIAQNMP